MQSNVEPNPSSEETPAEETAIQAETESSPAAPAIVEPFTEDPESGEERRFEEEALAKMRPDAKN